MVNVQAILALMLSALVFGFLHQATAGPGDPHQGLYAALSLFVVAGLCEGAGLKGRLFTFPLYLWGLVAAAAFGYTLYGPWVAAGAAALALAALVRLGHQSEKEQLVRLKRAREASEAGAGDELTVAQTLETALVVPPGARHPRDLCSQNRRTVSRALELAGRRLDFDEVERLATYGGTMALGEGSGAGADVPADRVLSVKRLLGGLAPTLEAEARQQFAEAVAAGGRDAFPTSVYDSCGFRLLAAGQDRREVSLERHFAGWREAPSSARVEQLRTAAAELLAARSALSAEDLEARPRSAAMVELDALELRLARARAADPVAVLLAPGVMVEVGRSRPDGFDFLSTDEARRLGLSPEQILEQVRGRLGSPRIVPSPAVPNLYVLSGPGVARHLLQPEVLHRVAVRGLAVAAAPTPDLLLVTGSEEEGGLQGLASAMKAALPHEGALGAAVLVLEGGCWQPFRLPEGHPAAATLHRLQVLERTVQYARQRRWLRTGRTEEVPEHWVDVEGDGTVTSSCWCPSRGVALLPEVDRVWGLKRGTAVPFESLRPKLKDAGLWPPRFKTL